MPSEQPSTDQLAFVSLSAPWRRALLALPLALVLAGAYFAARWCLGNTLAANPTDLATARAAADLAPDDPQAHYTLAEFARRDFTPDALAEALRRYERAAEAAPNDYRLWVELGRARGQAGDVEGGVQALRRAAELAPSYSRPRWYLGNLLLRAGEPEAAFAELGRAAEFDSQLDPQVFGATLNYFRGDAGEAARALAASPASQARLAAHLAQSNRVDDALKLWFGIDASRRAAFAEQGRALLSALITAKRFGAAHEVWRGLAPAAASSGVVVGQVSNGSFESAVGAEDGGDGGNPFDWSAKSSPQAQIGLDPRAARGGARSLRVNFNASGAFTFGPLAQLVLVEPRARYRLTYFFRAEELKSVSTLRAEVRDACGGGVLAQSEPLPPGTTTDGWREVSFEFASPDNCDGVRLSVARDACPEGVCPIYGKVWYDDFSLQRIGG